MALVWLPVAGREVDVRAPAGVDDLMLLEAGPASLGSALAFLARLVTGDRFEPAALPISDVDALLLRVRQQVAGDAIAAHEVCRDPSCRTAVDIGFSIDAYLEHHAPAVPSDVIGGEPGWFRLAGGTAEFRVPLAEDQLAIRRAPDPELALVERCVRPAASSEEHARIERALEAMSPSLCSALAGVCPACGAEVTTTFDPLDYTLREQIARARYLYDEVCAIAHYCHWSEADILRLPAARRARYAELANRRAAERASA